MCGAAVGVYITVCAAFLMQVTRMRSPYLGPVGEDSYLDPGAWELSDCAQWKTPTVSLARR
jgi:hypothetical protein